MVSLRRSTSVMGILLALLLSLTSVGVVALPAQAATASTVVSINSSSPTMNRLSAGTCNQSGTTAHYTVVEFSTRSYGNMAMDLNITTSGPVTAMLYQSDFQAEPYQGNCYINAWGQSAGQMKVTTAGFDNSENLDFDPTWYLVLASDDPSAGVSASVSVTTNKGTVAIDNPPVITTSSLPTGSFGVAYNGRVDASGTQRLTLTATGLPAGLTMSDNGTIYGTPTVVGTFTVAVTLRDGFGRTVSRNLGLSIAAPAITVAPTTLPAPKIGAAYNQTVAASGGIGPYIYALTAGTLPAGLSFSAGGVLSGTPTAGGTFNFTITATDANSYVGAQAYSMTMVMPDLTLSPSTLPQMEVGVPYTTTMTAAGGVAPYTFAVQAETLPPGIVLSAQGVFSGTPTTAGTFGIFLSYRESSTGNGAGWTYSTRRTVVVVPAPTLGISPATLPNGATGRIYSQQFSGSNGVAPYTFALDSGSLPAGLSLSSAGLLSGTPTASGTFPVGIRVTDSQGRTNTIEYPVVIARSTIAVTPTTLPVPTAYSPYAATVTASGGVGPYSFAVAAGALPSGITLASNGTLSGTTTVSGTFNVTFAATDSSTGTGPTIGYRSHSFTVNAATLPSITPGTVPWGTAGTAYSQQLSGATGVAPYTFSVESGALPAGISLSSAGLLSGTPTVAGNFPISIKVVDARTLQSTTSITLTVGAPTISLMPVTLPGANVGVAYSVDAVATGGTAPHSFAVTAGSLPAGLTLTAAGKLAGTPTAPGTKNFTITATDKFGFTGSRAYSLFSTPAALVLGPATLPAPTAGAAYSAQLVTTGGYGTFSYAITSGTLSPGLSLNAGTGLLSGTPTAVGSYSFTITSTDVATAGPNPVSVNRSYTLVVPSVPLQLVGQLPQAHVGSAYAGALAASGGTGPYTFALQPQNTLPAGLSLTANGLLTGTPTLAGSFDVAVKVTDVYGSVSNLTGSLTIAPLIAVNPATLPGGQTGRSYAQQLTASGGTAPYAFTVTAGTLPAGLSLAANGALTGTPTVHGSSTFTVTAKDDGNFPGTKAYTLTVKPAAVVMGPATLPAPVAGSAYSAQLSATGGIGPFTFAVTAGSLPPGLVLAAGTISGTPTAVGSYAFTVTATDAATLNDVPVVTASKAYTLVVPSVPLELMGTLPQAHVGSGYSGALAGTGGTGPYTFALQPQKTLPAGLTLAANGLLTGTPTVACDVDLDITLTDVYGSTSNATASLTVAPLVVVAPEDLPESQTGGSYSQQLAASGGTAPYTFVVTAGTLPAGLSLSANGALTGTPTVHGSSTFTVTAKDAGGFPGSKAYTLTTIPAAVVLGPETLPVPAAGSEYSAQLASAGGIGPFSYSVTAGSLPAGLALAADTGIISGTPTAVGSFEFTVTTTDEGTANDPIPVTASRDYTVEVPSVPLVLDDTKPLPQAQTGQAYTAQLAVTGGSAPYTFALSGAGARMARAAAAASSLPQGLSLSTAGVLSGTPTVSGDFKLSLTVTDTFGSTSEVSAALKIVPAATPSPTATPSVNPSATPTPATASQSPTSNGKGKLAVTGTTGTSWLIVGGVSALALGLAAMGLMRRRTRN